MSSDILDESKFPHSIRKKEKAHMSSMHICETCNRSGVYAICKQCRGSSDSPEATTGEVKDLGKVGEREEEAGSKAVVLRSDLSSKKEKEKEKESPKVETEASAYFSSGLVICPDHKSNPRK